MTATPQHSRRQRLLRLLGYARPYRAGWITILLTGLLSGAVAVAQPWPLKLLVDQLLSGHPWPALLQPVVGRLGPAGLLVLLGVSVVALFLLTSLIDLVLTYTYIRVGQRMVYDLAADLFAIIQRRSLRFHSATPVGDSMSRITGDSWCVYSIVDLLLLTPVKSLVSMTAMLVVMAQMNVRLMLAAVAAAPVMVAASLVLGKRVRQAARGKREIESAIQSHVQQTLSGIHVVQAFAQEERHGGRFHQFASAAIRAQQRTVLLTNLAGLGSGFASTLGRGAVLLIGALQVLRGALSLGELLIFLAYLDQMQGYLKSLVSVYPSMQNLRGQADRVMEILEADPEVADSPTAHAVGAVRGEIQFQQVSFGYETGRTVLADIDLHVHPGQTLAIVGPTGAGKSTLVGLIPRFFDPWSGCIRLDGQDLRSLKLRQLRQKIALVLQEPFLFPLSIAQNIAYGRPDASAAQIEAAARAANAHEFIVQLAQGYDSVIGERGATLSGGQRQRLSIARALLKDAPVLILDEPTSALDTQTESLLLEALERLMKGRTTFIIAHRLSTIRNADSILVLENGRIVQQGPHSQLVRQDGLYAAMYGAQYATTGEGSA